jgi:hypothetical protein
MSFCNITCPVLSTITSAASAAGELFVRLDIVFYPQFQVQRYQLKYKSFVKKKQEKKKKNKKKEAKFYTLA